MKLPVFLCIGHLLMCNSFLLSSRKGRKSTSNLSVNVIDDSYDYDKPSSSPQTIRQSMANNVQKGFDIAAKCIVAVAAVSTFPSISKAAGEGFKLPDLPYSYDSLEPYISKNTLFFHHDKHHSKYIATTNSMIKGTEFETISDLSSVMIKSHDTNKGLFNNAAQSWNHDFYWKCMKPFKEGAKSNQPSGLLLSAINDSFGSIDEFKKQFKTAGLTTFGSGWVWLVLNGKTKKLEIIKTIGAENPLVLGLKPILTMDVWEHAYYLDYQNERDKYEDSFINKLINWDFVASQYSRN